MAFLLKNHTNRAALAGHNNFVVFVISQTMKGLCSFGAAPLSAGRELGELGELGEGSIAGRRRNDATSILK